MDSKENSDLGERAVQGVSDEAAGDGALKIEDNEVKHEEEAAEAEAKKQIVLSTETGSGDQRTEDSYLTEEDIFQMKNLTAERGGV